MEPTARSSEQVYDEWLVLRAQDGETAALAELVRRWHPRLVGLAVSITGSEHDARDAVQEAWLAAARTLVRLGDPARFPAWICRIVANKCADAVRRARGDRLAARGKAGEQPAGIVNPSSAAGDLEEAGRIRRAMARLGPDQRHLLGLHYGAGLGMGAMAEALGVPEGTVKSRLHAARNELRSAMERMSDEQPRPDR
jgi:RNA polymerase sigma-70 factor (ECF subfamily)